MKITILSPVYNDWESFISLVADIDHSICSANIESNYDIRLFAINDGSDDEPPNQLTNFLSTESINEVGVINLITNLGHQKAIAVGLSHIFVSDLADVVIVMDADGEDKPSDLLRLIASHTNNPDAIILAKRGKRTESFIFRIGYRFYRSIFRLSTGVSIPYGNFSLLPRKALRKIVHSPALWNHYAAAIRQSNLPAILLPTNRGHRYAGNSKMSLSSLISHGLRAMSVFSDRIASRLIITLSAVTFLLLILISMVIGIKLFTELATPGWTSQITSVLAVASLFCAISTLFLAFTVIISRQAILILPALDSLKYIKEINIWHIKKTMTT